MHLKLISSAALALSLVAGAAIAQTHNTADAPETSGMANTNPSADLWASPEEQAMYEGNRETMSVFFVDDNWSAWRSDDELRAAWDAMSPEDQAAMKASCEEASAAETTLGPASTSICGWAGVQM